MDGNIVYIYRSRQEMGKGIIYSFDLSLVLNAGVRSSLVGYAIVNIDTAKVRLGMSHDLMLSEKQKSNIINKLFVTAKEIERDIFG